MSVVTFDAPQSVGDELLSDGLGELDGTIVDDQTETDVAEIAEDLGLATTASQEPKTIAESAPTPVAVEVSGDPIQVVNHQLTQAARETSVDHYESERSEEADLLDQIWNAERDCRKAESRVELLKEELKEAKSQYEQSMLRLREIINENSGCFHNSSRSVKVVADPVYPSYDGTPAVSDETKPASDETITAEPETTNPLAWRAVSLSELFREPIKGLGAKKQEALIDLCPTLGDLEDLRATVGRAASQFHELLPKGIGLETASTIEDRLLDWIARNPKACAEIGTDAATIDTRADQLADDPAGLVARHPNGSGYWQSGRDAWNADAGIEECPWTPGMEQDDWLRGWMAADNDDKESKAPESESAGEAMTLENDDPEEVAAEPASQMKPEARKLQQVSSLDDL